MKPMKSIEFYNTWIELVNSNKESLLDEWRNSVNFTKKIITDDNSIICQLANKNNLLCYNRDYYAIDAVLYKNEDLVPDLNQNSIWLRDIKVAFEHENDFNSGLYQEVAHLLITNAELKVLVSYPDYEPDEELAFLHKVISNTRHSDNLSKHQNFLVIFGYEKGYSWEGYLYHKESWLRI